jgi:hypothetical protein
MDLASVVFVKQNFESVYFFFNNPVRFRWATMHAHDLFNPLRQTHKALQANSLILPVHGAVRLQKPILTQLLKKFTDFYGIQRFITVFTKSHYWSLSWAKWIQTVPSYHRPWIQMLSALHQRIRPSTRLCVTLRNMILL